MRNFFSSIVLSTLLLACGGSGSGSSSGNDGCSSLTASAPVGIACIYCMHPKAQNQAMEIASIARATCRNNLAVNYLIDGTFGTDDQFISEHITALSADRDLTVIFYLSNGAAQRIWQQSLDHGFGTSMSPEDFRARIFTDQQLRADYQAIVRRALAIKEGAPASVRFILVPGLEDNLTDQAFSEILNLTIAVAGSSVEYGRSPAPGIYPGNEGSIPPGVLPEIHTINPAQVAPGAIITNDGTPTLFPDEVPNGRGFDQLRALKTAALGSNAVFLLWIAEYQGLGGLNVLNSALVNPDTRDYKMPTAEERAFLIDFLK